MVFGSRIDVHGGVVNSSKTTNSPSRRGSRPFGCYKDGHRTGSPVLELVAVSHVYIAFTSI